LGTLGHGTNAIKLANGIFPKLENYLKEREFCQELFLFEKTPQVLKNLLLLLTLKTFIDWENIAVPILICVLASNTQMTFVSLSWTIK
jgi:hypothetical protein